LVVCTALSSKISNRQTEYAQKITGDYQNGFRINTRTINNAHIFIQIIEKAWVYIQRDILFIDWTKHLIAFKDIKSYKYYNHKEHPVHL
jgi:hypothetical protein